MSRHFGPSSYHPNEHYMRGPGPACAQNARNILKNARPASPDHAPAGDAGPLFVLDEAAFMAAIAPPSQTLQNFAASTFSYFVLAVPFTLVFVGVSIWALFFAPSLLD